VQGGSTTASIRSLCEAHTFEVTSLGAVPVPTVRQCLEDGRFAILRGLAGAGEVAEAMTAARAAFSCADDHAVVGETPDQVRGNFQKWSVGTGTGNHRSSSYARFIRVIFTPLFAEDRYGVHALLRRVAVVRNRLLGLADDFALDTIEEGLWTAARLQQYPSGGGFIQEHVDQTAVGHIPSGGSNYVQVLMVLTTRGADFERGGAYLEHPLGRVDLEDHVELGDIVVYDERTRHGVDDIDPHKVLDVTSLSGRVAGFANLYRAF
jgi:hypothetical protein